MRQVSASKQGHKGRFKGGNTSKKVGKRPFSTDRVPDQQGEKIDRLIAPEAPTHQTHLLLKRIKQPLGLEMVSHDHDFCKPCRDRRTMFR